MLVLIENGKAIGTIEKFSLEHTNTRDRWDWSSFEQVEKIAAELLESTGIKYMAVDRGAYTSPRFDIAKAPAIGDKVSRGFNGDYYPCGEIVKISKTGKKITTSDGVVFNRKGLSDSFLDCSKCFAMVSGHISRWNPEF